MKMCEWHTSKNAFPVSIKITSSVNCQLAQGLQLQVGNILEVKV